MHLQNWPFDHIALLAGLRRYLAASNLHLLDVKAYPRPATLPGGCAEGLGYFDLRTFVVTVEISGQDHRLALLLKEAPNLNISCEHGLYRFLAPHLPVLLPDWVAAESDWIVTEMLDTLRPSDEWEIDDYREAMDNLALLHDRYWNLADDLNTFDWLTQPLDRDYDKLRSFVRGALTRLSDTKHLPALNTPRYETLLQVLHDQFDDTATYLRNETYTLLHGDYWADNIARPLDGRQIITNWGWAAIGPAILDVVMFYQQTLTYLNPILPLPLSIARYRSQLNERQHRTVWNTFSWDRAWDYALIWSFLVHQAWRLAEMKSEDFEKLLKNNFKALWLEPVAEAAERRLSKNLPN